MTQGYQIKGHSRFVFIGILVTVFLFPVYAAVAQNDQVVSSGLLKQREQVEAYWTSTRIRNAKPMDFPTLTTPNPQAGVASPQLSSNPSILAFSGGPGEKPTQRILSKGEQLDFASPTPTFGVYPFSYTRYQLFPDTKKSYKIFPYNLIGRLLFTIPGQGDFVCTAEVINAANLSVVWTAGHCVNTPGVGFHTNFIFFPALRLTKAVYGSWIPIQVFTTTGWANTGLFEYDHGALVVARGGKLHLRIGEHLGFLGFLTDVSRLQHWHEIGYPLGARDLPSTPPGPQFDGAHQEICASTWATDDQPSGGALDPKAIGVGCDQTGGASGGPWLIDLNGVGGFSNIVNGNSSYKYNNQPLVIYSPYFTTAAANVRNAAAAINVP
jgi:V8-like Glu-specific endopeptidase